MEVPRLDRLGVHQEPSASDLLTQGNRPEDDISEHPSAEPTALVADIDPESSKERDRLWRAARALAHRRRRIGERDAGHALRVVGNDDVGVRWSHHQHTRRAVALGLTSMSTQPVGLLRRPALEPVENMIRVEQLGRAVGAAHSSMNGEGRSRSRRRPGRSRARRRLTASQAATESASSSNSRSGHRAQRPETTTAGPEACCCMGCRWWT